MAKKKTAKKSSPQCHRVTITSEGGRPDPHPVVHLSFPNATLREHMAFKFAEANINAEGLPSDGDSRATLADDAVAFADALLAKLAKPRKADALSSKA